MQSTDEGNSLIDTTTNASTTHLISSEERADTDTLTVEEMILAQTLIEQDHLYHPKGGIPLSDALPFLRIFTKCFSCCNKEEDSNAFSQVSAAESSVDEFEQRTSQIEGQEALDRKLDHLQRRDAN